MIGNGCFHHLFALATVLYSTVHNYTLDKPLRDTTIVTMINWFNVFAARFYIIVRCLCHFNHLVDIVYVCVCTRIIFAMRRPLQKATEQMSAEANNAKRKYATRNGKLLRVEKTKEFKVRTKATISLLFS